MNKWSRRLDLATATTFFVKSIKRLVVFEVIAWKGPYI